MTDSSKIGCTYLAMVVPLYLWRAYALKTLWAWFVVPTLGLVPLGYAAAIGLTLTAGMLVHRSEAQAARDGNSDAVLERHLGWEMAYPAGALVVGWIAQYWM